MIKVSFGIDLDGTILFLATDWEGVRARLKELYISYDLNVQNTSIFKSLDEAIFKSITEAQDMTSGQTKAFDVREKAYEILEDEEVKGVPNVTLREGALELLDFLKGNSLVLVTSNCKKAVLGAFKRLNIDEKIFTGLVTRDDVRNLKPDKEPILKALDIIKKDISGGDFYYIGDQKNDVLAARAASEYDPGNFNIKTVAVCGGATYEDKLRASNPDYFTKGLDEVLKILKGKLVD